MAEQGTYTLYYSPGACSMSPHVALREAGLPFELVRVDLKTKKYDGERDYLEVNPKGYVPTLRLPDGRLLTENIVTVQYIADRAPEKRLAPELGSFARVRFEELLVFLSTELHKGFAPLFPSAKANDEYRASVKEKLGKRLTYLGSLVGDRPVLFGDGFSVADGYAFFCLRTWKTAAKDPFPGPYLGAYYARLLERPSIREALAAENIEG